MCSFHTIGKNTSITEVLFTIKCLPLSLESWKEEKKVNKEYNPFSSHILIDSEVTHMNKKNEVMIILDQEKFLINVSGEVTKIVNQSVPCHCIDRVIGDKGGRVVFSKDSDTEAWTKNNSRRHVGSVAAAKTAAAAAAIFIAVMAPGDRWHQVTDKEGIRKKIGEPVAYETEVIKSSEIDLRINGITQEEVYID